MIKNSTIDIDFFVNNIKTRKSIFNLLSKDITIECELNVNQYDILKIIGYVSGVIPTVNYLININSNILLYYKTFTVTNLINIKNIYETYFYNNNVKIINELFNKSTSNFWSNIDNLNYIIGEKYILTYQSNYKNIIYGKFVKENIINTEIVNYLSDKIKIIPIETSYQNKYTSFINNSLSQILDCGWWCKGYCDIFNFNYRQIIPPYKYGSLQDATGLFVIKLIVMSLNTEINRSLLNYFNKITNYLINMQYSNGGIPQYYPLQEGYFNNICMNDGAYLNYLKILAYIIDNASNNFIDNTTLNNLINCQKKAFNLLKQLQIKVNDIPTIWAMQYDSVTLEPKHARTYEPACLGSLESCQILIYLKEINFTYNNYFDNELLHAYNAGITWFSNNSINNLIQTIKYDENNTHLSLCVYKNTSGIPCRLWARMYDLIKSNPIYVDKQGTKYNDLNLLDNERKLGYTWLGNWGEYLLNL